MNGPRIGLVGAGFIGTIHAYALAILRDAGIVDGGLAGVHDLDARRAAHLAHHHGGVPMGSLDELVDAVDALFCCTWTGSHLDAVAAAAAAGIPVFCEKPLGRDLAEAESVAAHLGKVPHRVGLVLRCSPVLGRLVDEVRSGVHGPVMAVVFRDDQYFPDHGIYRSDWRADPARAGSGTLLEHSIHDVDVLLQLLGPPASVSALTARRTGRAVEDLAALLLAYDEGATAQLTSVWHDVTSRTSTRRLEVLCERAVLTVDDDAPDELVVAGPDGTERVPCPPPAWTADLGVDADVVAAMAGYLVQAREVVDDLAGGGPWRGPGAAEAIAAHRVVDAAYRSAAGGAPVACAPAGPAA